MLTSYKHGENDCEGCLYKRMPSDGGHCYMFREEPKPRCAQWKSVEGNIGELNAEHDALTQKYFAGGLSEQEKDRLSQVRSQIDKAEGVVTEEETL